MKKITLIALLTATALLSACDDATKEKAQATLDEVTQKAGELKAEADSATQKLVDSAETAGKEAQAALDNGLVDSVQQKVDGQLAVAQEKVEQVSDMKVSEMFNAILGTEHEAGTDTGSEKDADKEQ